MPCICGTDLVVVARLRAARVLRASCGSVMCRYLRGIAGWVSLGRTGAGRAGRNGVRAAEVPSPDGPDGTRNRAPPAGGAGGAASRAGRAYRPVVVDQRRSPAVQRRIARTWRAR